MSDAPTSARIVGAGQVVRTGNARTRFAFAPSKTKRTYSK